MSDPGAGEPFYKSTTWQRIDGVDLGVAPAPVKTIALRFRRPLNKHNLGGAILDAVNLHLAAKNVSIETGTIVAATSLHAPSSTENEKKVRDPVMRQTLKGKQWDFGIEAHIGFNKVRYRGVSKNHHRLCANAPPRLRCG